MKLVLCPKCSDVFKLDLGVMRQCKCGHVKGRYIDNVHAEVSKDAVSIAIGNGSLQQSWIEAGTHQATTNDTAERAEYYQDGQGKIEYAWVRPNEGPGNPHCKVIKE